LRNIAIVRVFFSTFFSVLCKFFFQLIITCSAKVSLFLLYEMLVLYTRNDSIDEKTRNKNLVISFLFICFLLINLETSFDCVICISDDEQSSQQNQSNLAMASRDDSPFCDTATFWDRQYHSIPRNIVEQPSSSSKRHVLAQSPLPVAMSQWEQLLNLQLLHHHVQQSHLLSQSTIPFCLPHLYGYQVPGVNAPGVPRPFTPIGTIDGSWHFAVVGGGGTSLKNHPQVSNLGYQFVCPYPFFPGNVGYLCKSGCYVLKNRICVCVCVS